MTNIINELEESNKKLIEKNENLKKQLADKEQEFKLRILNAVNNVTSIITKQIILLQIPVDNSCLFVNNL